MPEAQDGFQLSERRVCRALGQPRSTQRYMGREASDEESLLGGAFRILNVIDEYTRECLAVKVARQLDHQDVQECLAELFCVRGVRIIALNSWRSHCRTG